MSGGFSDREEAFEAKFKHDQEMQFKRTVKAVKLFGLWVAAELGLKGTQAEEYAKSVVDADFDEPGLADVIKKVKGDFAAKKIAHSDHRIESELNKAMKTAGDEMLKGK